MVKMNGVFLASLWCPPPRGFVLHQPDPDTLEDALRQYTELSPSAIGALSSFIVSTATSKKDTTQIPSIGRLAGLDWRLGVALQSSECKALLTPYVNLVLRVEKPDGKRISRSVEVSHAEFEVCRWKRKKPCPFFFWLPLETMKDSVLVIMCGGGGVADVLLLSSSVLLQDLIATFTDIANIMDKM